ncbi:MAG: hypothetical protein LBK83_15610 [Treponema sp.]|jgi:hypothetical protein|nr:hypothetical protein [Treponema sp.]
MKNKWFAVLGFLLVFGFILTGCDTGTGGTSASSGKVKITDGTKGSPGSPHLQNVTVPAGRDSGFDIAVEHMAQHGWEFTTSVTWFINGAAIDYTNGRATLYDADYTGFVWYGIPVKNGDKLKASYTFDNGQTEISPETIVTVQ